MKLTLFALFTNPLRDEWFRKKRVLPHSLHRYPEPVIVDMEEMNAPVAETVKTEDQHHLVPDVLFFHEALYCPYIAFFKSCVQIFRNDQQRSFVESVVYDGIS